MDDCVESWALEGIVLEKPCIGSLCREAESGAAFCLASFGDLLEILLK